MLGGLYGLAPVEGGVSMLLDELPEPTLADGAKLSPEVLAGAYRLLPLASLGGAYRSAAPVALYTDAEGVLEAGAAAEVLAGT